MHKHTRRYLVSMLYALILATSFAFASGAPSDGHHGATTQQVAP